MHPSSSSLILRRVATQIKGRLPRLTTALPSPVHHLRHPPIQAPCFFSASPVHAASGSSSSSSSTPATTATMSTTTTTTSTAVAAATATAAAPAAPPITAEAMLRQFPVIDTSAALEGHDEEQIRLMDEVCIVVDENDGPIGKASKKCCHLMANIDKGLLHRAFSVFLFNSAGRLLLQQRAAEKITFPDMWTNTCCSHPLAVASETGDTLARSVEGVKRAAQRKLEHELGIPAAQVPLDRFRFLTRIHYRAGSDAQWGEHEIDYILFITADVDLAANPNEVRDTRYVTADQLRDQFADPALKFTPWFELICNSMLFKWWESVADGSLDKHLNEQEIRRML